MEKKEFRGENATVNPSHSVNMKRALVLTYLNIQILESNWVSP